MNINSAIFKRGVTNSDNIVEDTLPQVALIGRSNVGKSSVINSLTNHKGLARSSQTPGRTQEANFFLINSNFYLVDLPGYGYAKASEEKRDAIWDLIQWYLFQSSIKHHKVVLILDAKVGATDNDLYMLGLLEEHQKDVVIVANKVDKLTKNELRENLNVMQEKIGNYPIIPYSAEKKIGVEELRDAIKIK